VSDLRGMLLADAVALVLGSVLLVSGLVVLILWAVLPRRDRANATLLAIFAFLYGLRLLARSATLRLLFDLQPAAWDYADAAITYLIPLPLFLFVRAVVPIWRRFTYWCAVALVVFAVCALASDAILRRPFAAITANNLIALALLAIFLGLVFRPGVAVTRDVRALRIGAVSWSLTGAADNLRGMTILAFRGPDLEPFGFTILVACLAVLVGRRAIEDGRRLAVIDRELSIARQIQSSIVPQIMPRMAGVTLAARYRPMNAVAGDFYDFIEIGEQQLGVLVADVSGHGIPAALLASMVKVAFGAQHERADRPAAVMTGMNEALCGRLAGQYVTAAYLFIDTRAGLIRYAAAGHPPMLHVSHRDRVGGEVHKNGLVLGFMRDVQYEQVEGRLEAGDRLLLYTDGLIEAMNPSDDFFGLERVKGTLAASVALSPDAAADKLLDEMDAWSGQPASDDLTIVLIGTGSLERQRA
jgi:sigma-B regulation protein RsbU (phosphoserine phosphatase)